MSSPRRKAATRGLRSAQRPQLLGNAILGRPSLWRSGLDRRGVDAPERSHRVLCKRLVIALRTRAYARRADLAAAANVHAGAQQNVRVRKVGLRWGVAVRVGRRP